ncbi:MAG: type III pantothenate kinase [Bacteroidales bacterium]|nr:type III pantothenate kinase [Bacteroidales bacterium]MBN2821484.1 type III pantothenate kinase [Bacteroidales bacterium]
MNLIIDIGNTLCKLAIFEGPDEIFSESINGNLTDRITALKQVYKNLDYSILSATGKVDPGLPEFLSRNFHTSILFDHQTPLPIIIDYNTPETLGLDRMAGAAGANGLFPDKNVLIIDAGSAITIDMKTKENKFIGGNISPGMSMRFRALHDYTHRLPLVKPGKNSLIGKTTDEAIKNGVINGIAFEVEQYFENLNAIYEDLTIILTGGDAEFFENRLKKTIFVVQNLVRQGLNIILNYNVAT